MRRCRCVWMGVDLVCADKCRGATWIWLVKRGCCWWCREWKTDKSVTGADMARVLATGCITASLVHAYRDACTSRLGNAKVVVVVVMNLLRGVALMNLHPVVSPLY
ncbi:hypothetical protein IF2G_07815 [Cordyceps javanica]|nr:hypothetical protein IF2G_07815 [Cordyceps javanica]